MKTAEEIAESVYPENDGEFTSHLKMMLKADIEAYALSVAESMVKAAVQDFPTLTELISDKYMDSVLSDHNKHTVIVFGPDTMQKSADLAEKINQIRRNGSSEHLTNERLIVPIKSALMPDLKEETLGVKDKIPCPKPYRKRGY